MLLETFLSMIQDRNYEDICSVPMKVVSDQAPNNTYLNAAALNIQEKFTEIFKRYSACHMLFNSRTTVDHQLLGKIGTLVTLLAFVSYMHFEIHMKFVALLLDVFGRVRKS